VISDLNLKLYREFKVGKNLAGSFGQLVETTKHVKMTKMNIYTSDRHYDYPNQDLLTFQFGIYKFPTSQKRNMKRKKKRIAKTINI